jgi:hypothetical protein
MSTEELFEQVFSSAQRLPQHLIEEEPTSVVETTQGDEDENPTLYATVESITKTSNVSVANVFRSPDAHPLVLDLMLLRKYNADWLGWELETIVHRVQEDFKTPSIADINIEKLQACKALHLVDDFWTKWEVFLHCCAPFNGAFADFQRMQAPAVAECMVAVDIANRIRDDVSFSGEVKTFLAAVHQHDGILCPQPPLDFVKVDVAELPIDCAEVTRRWPEVRASGRAPDGASAEDEQLRRLLGSWAYLESTRLRLRSQLEILKHV